MNDLLNVAELAISNSNSVRVVWHETKGKDREVFQELFDTVKEAERDGEMLVQDDSFKNPYIYEVTTRKIIPLRAFTLLG